MDSVFCCSSIRPYRPQYLSYEGKFDAFMKYAKASTTVPQDTSFTPIVPLSDDTYVVQVVRQVNFGPIEWKKYFANTKENESSASFYEVSENDLIESNFQKLNSYKNFKCSQHNRFFELSLYEKDPVNTHH
ncbi:hypothetical protein BDZ45DRAFT_758060 [Acephala macrosclerotiorum]|nr:hypothetical protein BDZ45DRAFT_758060 [Acephala macrosclerotiorum]